MARSRTPVTGVPVLNIHVDSAPIKKGNNGVSVTEDSSEKPLSKPSWAKVIAVVGGSISTIVLVVVFVISSLNARPTRAEVNETINDHDVRLRTVETRQAATDAKLEWMTDTLSKMAEHQGVRVKPIPTDLDAGVK